MEPTTLEAMEQASAMGDLASRDDLLLLLIHTLVDNREELSDKLYAINHTLETIERKLES